MHFLLFPLLNLEILEFSLNIFTEFAEFSNNKKLKIRCIAVFDPTVCCVTDKYDDTVPQRHR